MLLSLLPHTDLEPHVHVVNKSPPVADMFFWDVETVLATLLEPKDEETPTPLRLRAAGSSRASVNYRTGRAQQTLQRESQVACELSGHSSPATS